MFFHENMRVYVKEMKKVALLQGGIRIYIFVFEVRLFSLCYKAYIYHIPLRLHKNMFFILYFTVIKKKK